jgi:ubiquitin fusion degradation protein 1
MELQPDSSVSLLDTDMEADVTPSQEYLDKIEQEQAAARKAAELSAQVEAAEARRHAEAAAVRSARSAPRAASRALEHVASCCVFADASAPEAPEVSRRDAAWREYVCERRARMQAAAADEARQAEIDARRHAIAAALPPEPSADAAGALLTAALQLPDGTRATRRFALDAPVAALFDFVESVGAGGLPPGGYRIVTRYPRRVLEGGDKGTLRDARLAAGQEAFVLESLR